MNNPYWKNICAIAERQRAKGIATYGQGIEMNPAMAKIGFHIQGDRAIHFTDEDGNIVTAKRALEAMK